MPASDAAKRIARHPGVVARAVLALLALAWGTFAFLAAGDPEPSWVGYAWATLLTGLLVTLAVGSWVRHRWTGAAAVALGMFTAVFFDAPGNAINAAPLFLMAVPLALSGVLLLWQGDRPKGGPAAVPRPPVDDELD